MALNSFDFIHDLSRNAPILNDEEIYGVVMKECLDNQIYICRLRVHGLNLRGWRKISPARDIILIYYQYLTRSSIKISQLKKG